MTDPQFDVIINRINKLFKVVALKHAENNPLAIQLLSQSLHLIKSIEESVLDYERVYAEDLK